MLKAPDGLERIAEVDMVVFDKTGTLTLGKAQLIDDEEISDTDLAAAAALAATSKHPYSLALVKAAEVRLGAVTPATGIEETPGEGLIRATPQGEERLGSAAWCGVDGEGGEGAEVWCRHGKAAPVRFRFADAMRGDAPETIAALKQRGLAVALLSGDRTGVVERMAQRVGARLLSGLPDLGSTKGWATSERVRNSRFKR